MTALADGYLALGDSYTIGEGVAPAARWPTQLQATLCAQGATLTAPEYLAVTGWSCAELSAAIEAQPLRGPYALVSVLIGVNDQYRGASADSRRDALATLLQQATERAASPQQVLVVSIPDWSLTPFAATSGRDRKAIAAEIDAYNQLLHTLATQAGMAWVDITACSRAYPTELAEDGLHPSPAQYQRWCQLIAPMARRCLQRPLES